MGMFDGKLTLPPETQKYLQDMVRTDPEGVHNLRERFVDYPAMYEALAPYEHQAFTYSATKDNPIMAAPLAIAAPLYYVAKQPWVIGAAQKLGIVGEGATPPSLDQLKAQLRGIRQGLLSGY